MQEQMSKVHVRKLVKDLADMYPDNPFDVAVAELVANSLDAQASTINLSWDDASKVLVVHDNGNGMDPSQFHEYHNFAAELKTRGAGIGFAGVGAKISFNIARQVITETKRGEHALASDWQWREGDLVWKPIALNHLASNGTRVEVHFDPNYLPTINAETIERVLRRYYFPLFISEFLQGYSAIGIYPANLQFIVNGVPIEREGLVAAAAFDESTNITLRQHGVSFGWGAIGVSKKDRPINNDTYGLLLCTHGKAIKAEMFGLSPGLIGVNLFGIVEVPELIHFLTTDKCNLRSDTGHSKELNALLDPIRDELKKFLLTHGVAMPDQERNHLSAKLERDLAKMIVHLPELQDFDGLLRKSQALRRNASGTIDTNSIHSRSIGGNNNQSQNSPGTNQGSGGSSREANANGKTPAQRQRSRKNTGPQIAFEDHKTRDETAWLDSGVVVINSGHSAYRNRINQDQAKYTYCMFAIGVALDKAELISPENGLSYVDRIITVWGQS